MNAGKFDDVNKLLIEYDFRMNENIPDKVKCLDCGKILINACQMPCGCRYCRVCVDELVESGCRVCPGNTDFCKDSNISNFQENYRIQSKISKIVVKCPQEKCSFESELINMNEHLRVCPMKSVKCVFYGLGCDQSNVTAAKMNEHLQLASYSHMEMLMGVIDNMRNEIDRLKTDSAMKAEKIELLEEEIKLMKEEKIDNLEKKIVTTVAKMDAGLSDMRQEWRDTLDSNEAVLKETNERYQTDMETRMSAAEKLMDKLSAGTFLWTIDNVAQRREKNEFIRSEYFYGKIYQYKMTLTMCANGDASLAGTGLSIYVYVYPDVRDQYLKWSLPADVSITIVNKANPNACRLITKNYKIKKPECYSRYQLNANGDFDFLYSDLSDNSLLIGDCFIVECRVDVRLSK